METDPITELLYCLFVLCLCSYSGLYAYRWPLKLRYVWEKEAHQLLLMPFHKNMPFQTAQSPCCSHCHQALPLKHMIPLISFLLLRGKCHYCSKKLHYRYPLIELAHITLCLPLLWLNQDIPSLFLHSILLSCLITITAIDFENQLIPDECNFLALACVLLLHLLSDTLESCVMGVIIGYLFIHFLNVGYKTLRKTEGIGLGDAKLAAVLGGWVTLPNLTLMLACASIVGILYTLFINKSRKDPSPFGPFLIFSATLIAFYNL